MTLIYPGSNYFQSPNWGYPYTRNPRRVKPQILAVIHIADSMSSAESQTRWGFTANKSWTFMLDRDGGAVQSLDPLTQTPWTNGDLRSPDRSNPIIAGWDYAQYNINEACLITIENVGLPFSDPITPQQIATIRGILAWGSGLSGIPISRDTVIGHYQINSETRVNCPAVPAGRAALFDALLTDTIPDTALPEGNPMPKILRVLTDKRAELLAGTKAYADARFPNPTDPASFTKTFGGDRHAPASYVVEGEAYRTATTPSVEWIEIAPTLSGEKTRLYVPAQNVTLKSPPPADCSAVEAERDAAIERATAVQNEALKALTRLQVVAKSDAETIRGM